MSVSVTWNHGDMMKAARRGIVDGLTAVQVEFQKDIGKMLNRHASNRSRGGTPSPVGSPPGKATGTLARSWQTPARNGFAVVDASGLSDPLRPRINHGSNLRYARIHEYGGTITGKPWLKIPVSKDAKRAEAQGASLITYKGLPLIFFTSKKGNLLLVSVKGAKAAGAKKIFGGIGKAGRRMEENVRRGKYGQDVFFRRLGKKVKFLRGRFRRVHKTAVFRRGERGKAEITVHYVLKKSVKMPMRPYVLPASRETQGKAAKIAGGFFARAIRRFK